MFCRNNSISPINQLLTCLRFYASAGHLSSVADYIGMTTASVSKIIVRVSEAIASLYPLYVKMSNPAAFVQEQNKFYEMAIFPRFIGLIDCTHVKIQSPGMFKLFTIFSSNYQNVFNCLKFYKCINYLFLYFL